MNGRTYLVFSSVVVLAVGAVLVSQAGPLNPPGGAVSSTYKTLTEVEPRIAMNATNTPGDGDSLYKITDPGSYYLTGNITGVAGKHGIEIASWGVTLDLNGFELDGFVAGTLDGITVSAGGPRNITVLNGSVREWDGNGINVSLAVACRVEGIIAANNTGDGITTGSYGVVTRCSSYNSDGKGITVGAESTVTNCTAVSSGGNGISLGGGSTISDCVSSGSGANGLTTGSDCVVTRCAVSDSATDGIRASTDTTVIECTVNGNGLDGIECSSGCVIRDNNCSGNGTAVSGGAGIHATGSNNRIEGNKCADADRGIDVDAIGNIIIKNTCSDNTTNWTIVAGNAYGPIVATPAGLMVNGNTAPSALGSTDANANYSY